MKKGFQKTFFQFDFEIGPGTPNFYYTTFSKFCQEKNANFFKLFFIPKLKKVKKPIDKMVFRCYNKSVKRKRNEKEKRKMENKKVWGFNCFGLCIVRITEDKIEEWNNNHPLFNQKIVSWKA